MTISKMVEESLAMIHDTQMDTDHTDIQLKRNLPFQQQVSIPPLLPERMNHHSHSLTQEVIYSFHLAETAIRSKYYGLANAILYFAIDKCDEMEKANGIDNRRGSKGL